MTGKGIIRVQKLVIWLEMIATDEVLNDTEKVEQINETIYNYHKEDII